MAGVGHHQSQELLGHVAVSTQQKAFGIGGGESDVDLFGNGGLVVALEVIFDHVVGPHVDADFVGADGALERRPTAITFKVVVSFPTHAAIHAWIGGTFALAPDSNSVKSPRVFGGLTDQIYNDAIQHQCSHTTYITVRKVSRCANKEVAV